jgi:hypothetical protein
MTVKFKDAAAAQACILKMNGRFFDGRKVCLRSTSNFIQRCELTADLRGTIYRQREVQEKQQGYRPRRSRERREGKTGQFRSMVGR